MTFNHIICLFPFAALANRLLVEFWQRSPRPRAWIESRRGVWWADILRYPTALSCITGTAMTLGLFFNMEGVNGSYAQLAFLYGLALIGLPQLVWPYSDSSSNKQ